jgi:predicted phage terminase large subunit-like protein
MTTDWITALEEKVKTGLASHQKYGSTLELAQAIDPSYVVREHLRLISDRLTQAVHDVEQGQSRYLIISLPPRAGKSYTTSIYFPLWLLSCHPDWPIMLLSHDPSLASGWGRQVRRLVEEEGARLGLHLSPDAGAAKEWETTQGGSLLSRSIRESVTGRGAKVMILDDLVKDFAEAHSPTTRDFTWDWWLANSRTRLHPPSLVVVIGTRWHEDDFIGRLLSPEYEGNPDQWEVITIPALAEDPDATDPNTKRPFGEDALGRFPGEPLLSPLVPHETVQDALLRWEDIRSAVGEYAWAGLFQQRPAPAAGSIFLNDWWQFYDPQSIDEIVFDRKITSWDAAFKSTKDSDWVVGQVWGTVGSRRYLLRQVRKRMSFTETLAMMDEVIATSGAYEHIVEDKANGSAIIDVLRERIPGMIPINPTTSKEARARAVTPEVEAGNVYLPASAPWLADFLGEMGQFPHGAHDDQVDCTTQALTRLRSLGVVTPLIPQATINRSTATVGRRRA